MTAHRSLILASASPRRRELLDLLGVDFVVRPVDLDESPHADESPAEMVLRLALAKARAAARDGELVLAADTTVVLDGEILGKPSDTRDAHRLLTALQGREHEVLTGVAVLDGTGGEHRTAVERTLVRIAPLGAQRIGWYVATGEPMDKAGAYAIQGLGATLVETIEGNYTNVVGLPLPTVRRLLGELGVELLELR